jgi:hypothetical protein
MRQRVLPVVFFLMMICAVDVYNANAAGLGVYGTYSGGKSDWTPDEGRSFKKDSNHLGGGLAFDSAPATDGLFNYQLNIGYDRFENRNSKAWGRADFEGVVVSNSFCFGGRLTPSTRLWLGPEIRLEWADGKPDEYPDYKIRMFGIGFGPVLGLNINAGDKFTFVIKTGYQYISYQAYGDGFYSHTTNHSTTTHGDDYDINEKMLYVTISCLFRTSDERR